MANTTAPANFLADLLASVNAPADPARDAYHAADAAHRDARNVVRVARGALAVAIRTHGYGRHSDAAAARLAAARARLAAAPHPDAR